MLVVKGGKAGTWESARRVKESARWWGEGGEGRSYLNLWGQGRSDVFRCRRSLFFECAYRRTQAKHTVKGSLFCRRTVGVTPNFVGFAAVR